MKGDTTEVKAVHAPQGGVILQGLAPGDDSEDVDEQPRLRDGGMRNQDGVTGMKGGGEV